MRRALPLLLLLAACGGLNLDAALDPREAQRRGAVEVAVKSSFPGILTEIEAGGGPALAAAYDAAAVPPGDREARTIQLQGDLGLYDANPSALATALVLYGA
jgi:hypothetical protein